MVRDNIDVIQLSCRIINRTWTIARELRRRGIDKLFRTSPHHNNMATHATTTTHRREYHKWERCHLTRRLKKTSMMCPWIRAFALAQHGPTMTRWTILWLCIGGKATTLHSSSTAKTKDKVPLSMISSSSILSTIRCTEQRLAMSSHSNSIPCTRGSRVKEIKIYTTRCTSLSTRHNSSMKCRRELLNPAGDHRMLQSSPRRDREPSAPLEARCQLPRLRVRTRSVPRRAQRRLQWNETKIDCLEYCYFLKTKNIDIR